MPIKTLLIFIRSEDIAEWSNMHLDKSDCPGQRLWLTGQLLLYVQMRKKAINRSYAASEFLICAADTHENFGAILEGFQRGLEGISEVAVALL